MTEEELATLEPYEHESMFYGAKFESSFNSIFGVSDSEDSADTNNSEAKE